MHYRSLVTREAHTQARAACILEHRLSSHPPCATNLQHWILHPGMVKRHMLPPVRHQHHPLAPNDEGGIGPHSSAVWGVAKNAAAAAATAAAAAACWAGAAICRCDLIRSLRRADYRCSLPGSLHGESRCASFLCPCCCSGGAEALEQFYGRPTEGPIEGQNGCIRQCLLGRAVPHGCKLSESPPKRDPVQRRTAGGVCDIANCSQPRCWFSAYGHPSPHHLPLTKGLAGQTALLRCVSSSR